jgi:hypothetical protein
MHEQERAEWLAHAIDDLIGKGSSPGLPQELDDQELETLMRVARMRLNAARSSAQAGLQYEGAVWREVLARLERRGPAAAGPGQDASTQPESTSGDFSAIIDPEENEAAELRDIVVLRRRMAEQAAAIAERHEDEVWRQVLSRIEAKKMRRSVLAFVPFRQIGGGKGAFRARAAAIGATVALAIAAVGPLPATGFAEHPAVDFVRFIGGHIGVSETDSPPAPPANADVVSSVPVTVQQAAELMGIAVTEPNPPEGFHLTSASLFDEPLSASEGSLLVLTYRNEDGSAALAVYQEAAAGSDLAVRRGSALDVVLAGGVPGTYFEGLWQPVDGELKWIAADGQTLLFEHSGVRTLVQYTGPRTDPVILVSVAESMLAR